MVQNVIHRWRFLICTMTFYFLLILDTEVSAKPSKFENSEWGPSELSFVARKPIYLPLNWRRATDIPQPPTRKQTVRELKNVRILNRLAESRSIEIIKQDQNLGSEFIAMINPHPKVLGVLERLIENISIDAAIAVFTYKRHFERLRPWHYSSNLNLIIKKPSHSSYPSGHATQSYLLYLLLSDIVPECRKHLRALSQRISINREIAGVHFHSDTTAGWQLAHQIYKQVRRSSLYSSQVMRINLSQLMFRCSGK